MDGKFKALQLKFNQGEGGHMPGDINRQTMVTGGTEGSHQYTRADTFSHIVFYKV